VIFGGVPVRRDVPRGFPVREHGLNRKREGDVAAADKITMDGEHGKYVTRVGALDLMILRYLPASLESLRELIRERQGDPGYSVATVTEALMILATLDGHGLI
jgi:hypothetical protein